jgi:dihydroxy-acid dehydratase
MVRISDSRMSGTAYGTAILHISPESAIGGTLALVKDGDIIELDLKNRKLTLHVPDSELEKRRKDWKAPEPASERGYIKLFREHVTQAEKGCDFDFLRGGSGSQVTRDCH